jgi:beta-galactosidase
MKMRLVAVVVAMLWVCGATRAAEESPRMKLNFDPGWKFIKEDLPGAKFEKFDDSKWAAVSCPHTFNDVDTFDDLSPGGHVGELTQWMGRTWYRKHFTPDKSWSEKKVFVEFEGVRQVAEVYINGHLLGGCSTGFTPFGFDLTAYLKFGEDNVLAVMADNTFDSHGKDFRTTQFKGFPWNDPHWHPAHGGIYRDVYLHVCEKVHVTLPLFTNLGTVGTYAYATDISEKSVKVGVEAEVQNESSSARTIDCVSEIRDHDGKVVMLVDQTGSVAAGEKLVFKEFKVIANPQRWEPDYPYLYTVVTTLRSDGKTLDRYETPLGIRSATWSVTEGFAINGHHLKLHGFGQKPTDEWAGLGAALPDWLTDFTLKMMKDGNANYIRWGHCAGPAAGVRWCDANGIIELQPGVDGEADITPASDPTGEFWKTRAGAFRDVIVYFRNNPSILLWEGGNQSVSEEHIQELKSYKEKYDPHGGRAYIHRRSNPLVGKYIDVSEGTEGGHEVPTKPVVEGEYDREESPRRVWDDFSPPGFGYKEGKGQTWNLNSEQFAVNQAVQFEKIAAPSHSGGAKWIFSDSTSGGRMTVEVARVSGNVDGVRLAKEAYYATQVIWADEPAIHIIGHWTYPADTKKTVFVMSNCDEVELVLNGQSLGKGGRSHTYVFEFKDVSFQPGKLEAIGYIDGKPVARHELKTAGVPVQLRLTSITGPKHLRADGSDIALVDVEAIDAEGNRCPTFQGRVDFTVTGPCVWRGGYNSGKGQSTNNTYLDLECGINRVAIRSLLKGGDIRVEAKTDGIAGAGVVDIVSHTIEFGDGYSSELPQTIPAAPLEKREHVMVKKLSVASAKSKQAVTGGKLIAAFSYSGPSKPCTVEKVAANGKIFSDRGFQFSDLPDYLIGGEYVLTPTDDRMYSALDLMQFAAGADMTVYVAHDDRLARPKWLTEGFAETKEKISVGDGKATLFKKAVKKDAGVTLGGNMDGSNYGPSEMYVVFAVPN